MLRCKVYFDMLNRVGVKHECDRWTDRQTNGWTDILVIANAEKEEEKRETPTQNRSWYV